MTESANTPSELADRVRRRFQEEFGVAPEALFFAPGRVNLIGAHLDYSGGFVLPLAVDLGLFVAARVSDSPVIRMRSLDQATAVDVGVESVGAQREPRFDWAAYPLGVWGQFRDRHGVARGVDLVFGGNLPIASGMSSSAAVEVATANALNALYGTGLSPMDLALIAHAAETEFVGVKCGIMDQFASALGRDGHALLLRCSDRSYEHVPIAGSGFEVLVMDTKKPRTLAQSGFNQRVAECAEAYATLRKTRERACLADYTLADLDVAGDALGGVVRQRAEHVVREMGRVDRCVDALRRGDSAGVGAMLTASHRSTAELYDVSCAELDFMTSTATAQDQVFGARLTGAGFGGCAIALVEPGRSDEVVGPIGDAFAAEFGVQPGFRVLHAGGGPRRLD